MSDIEGSTRLIGASGDLFPALLDAHFDILRRAIEANEGTLVSTEGDAVFAVFQTARRAIAAAADSQRALAEHDWPAGMPLKVRMGIHVGEAVMGGRDYTGLDVHRTARITSAAWGGQVLVSQAVESLVGDAPGDATLLDLGAYSLRDIADPERLYQLRAPGLTLDFPPPRTAVGATPTNLPTPMTGFVGRARELLAVRQLLADARLLTLTGPGGTGKTRLAIETARRMPESYPDGVWFVALDSVRDPGLVVPTIAHSVGVLEQPGRSIEQLLAERLVGKRVLLVLDNFEQVVDAAPTLGGVLARSASVAALVTSREPLGIGAERVYPVPTLALPSEPGEPTAADLAGSESVQLFVDRARAVRPGFALTDENAADIAAICRRVDGLPLAIELAAARINVLAPAQIRQRLDRRLSLAASSRRDVPERQRTLRGAIDWSHEMLAQPERVIFRRLSVFAGGAALESVLAVVEEDGDVGADPLDTLALLVDRSLVRSDQEADEARFEMLETIREYAAEKLDEADERTTICERHAEHFAQVAGEARNVLSSAARDSRLDQLDREMPNLRAALDWTIGRADFDRGCRMCVGLKDFWRLRGHLAEGLQVMLLLLERSGAAEASAERADFLSAVSELANWHGDYEIALDLGEQHIAMRTALGDTVGAGKAWTNIGWSSLVADPARARDAFAKSIEVTRATDDDAWLMGGLQGLSLAYLGLGDLEAARQAALEAIEIGDRASDPYTNAINYMTLGAVEGRLGNLEAAAEDFAETLRRSVAAGSVMNISIALDGMATLSFQRGDARSGALLAAASERMRRQIGGAPSMEMIGAEAPLLIARRVLSSGDYERLAGEGAALSDEAAVALGFEVAAGTHAQSQT